LALSQRLDTLIKWIGDPVLRMFVLFRVLDCVQNAESSIPSCDVPLLDPFWYYIFFFVSSSWSCRIFSESKFMLVGFTRWSCLLCCNLYRFGSPVSEILSLICKINVWCVTLFHSILRGIMALLITEVVW